METPKQLPNETKPHAMNIVNTEEPKPKPLPTVPPLGRNSPCLCGSGRKVKHCHKDLLTTRHVMVTRKMIETWEKIKQRRQKEKEERQNKDLQVIIGDPTIDQPLGTMDAKERP